MASQRELALDLMKQHRLSEALGILEGLLETGSADWSLYYMAGQCCRFTNRYPEAVSYLSKAASLNPEEPYTFFALGMACQLDGKYQPALQSLEEAVRLDPDLTLAYSSLGFTYRKMGDFGRALAWYSRAAEVILAACAREVCRQNKEYAAGGKTGKDRLAGTRFLRQKVHDMLCSTPEYSNALNNMGICLMELGDLYRAREKFKESIKFIPEGYLFPNPIRNLKLIS